MGRPPVPGIQSAIQFQSIISLLLCPDTTEERISSPIPLLLSCLSLTRHAPTTVSAEDYVFPKELIEKIPLLSLMPFELASIKSMKRYKTPEGGEKQTNCGLFGVSYMWLIVNR